METLLIWNFNIKCQKYTEFNKRREIMAYRFLDLLESEYKEDVSSIKDQLKTKHSKTYDIFKEAFSGMYTSKECALDKIQKDFLNEKIAPKSIDASWLKDNMDYVVSTLRSLSEGDIKIIINNGDSNKPTTASIGYEMEGKKRPGRPSAASVDTTADTVAEPVTTVAPTTVPGTDKTTQEPLIENPPKCNCNCQKKESAQILPECNIGDMVTVNDKQYVVDGMEGDTVFVSDEDGEKYDFKKSDIEKVTECSMKTEDDKEADAADKIPGHESGESDEEETEEHKKPDYKERFKDQFKKPTKWADIEASMAKRESVEETVADKSIPMSEMLIQKRPITWNDIERSIFKKNTPKVKNDAEEEIIKVANGLTSEPEGQKAYSADKQIKPMDKASNVLPPKGEPSANSLTTKTGVKVSNPSDKQIKSQGEPTKQVNLTGKKDAGSKAYTSKPGVKVSNTSDKQIKPIKK
jgi:hypothetical protein